MELPTDMLEEEQDVFERQEFEDKDLSEDTRARRYGVPHKRCEKNGTYHYVREATQTQERNGRTGTIPVWKCDKCKDTEYRQAHGLNIINL